MLSGNSNDVYNVFIEGWRLLISPDLQSLTFEALLYFMRDILDTWS